MGTFLVGVAPRKRLEKLLFRETAKPSNKDLKEIENFCPQYPTQLLK